MDNRDTFNHVEVSMNVPVEIQRDEGIEDKQRRILRGITSLAMIVQMHKQELKCGTQTRKRLTKWRWMEMVKEEIRKMKSPRHALKLRPYVPRTFGPLHTKFKEKWTECSELLFERRFRIGTTLSKLRLSKYVYQTAPGRTYVGTAAFKESRRLALAAVNEAGDSLDILRLVLPKCPKCSWAERIATSKIKELEAQLLEEVNSENRHSDKHRSRNKTHAEPCK